MRRLRRSSTTSAGADREREREKEREKQRAEQPKRTRHKAAIAGAWPAAREPIGGRGLANSDVGSGRGCKGRGESGAGLGEEVEKGAAALSSLPYFRCALF